MRVSILLFVAIAALWPLWAMFIDAATRPPGGFLSWGDLITVRTPAIAACIVLAYVIGRREGFSGPKC